jgi:thiol:disulfide interchange protein
MNRIGVIALLAVLIFLGGCLENNTIPTEEKIQWKGYEEGMDIAKEQKKPVLIDFYADWCSPCKKMDENTYSDARVVEKSNEFVCVKVNTAKRGDLASEYNVMYIPTTLFLNYTGKELHKVVGYKNSEDFLEDMEYALDRS